MADFVTQQQAERLAVDAVTAYIAACSASTPKQHGDALMKLCSVAGVLMAQAEGSKTAVLRLAGTARFIAKTCAAIEATDPGATNAHVTTQRDNQRLHDLLQLVAWHDVPLEAIAGWSDSEAWAAEKWALAAYLYASDNAVKVPPVPAWVAAWPRPALEF